VLKVICEFHNHDLAKRLVGHPYSSKLRHDKHDLVVEMTKVK